MQSKEPPLEQGRPPGEGHSRHTKAFSCQGREEGQEEIVREQRKGLGAVGAQPLC